MLIDHGEVVVTSSRNVRFSSVLRATFGGDDCSVGVLAVLLRLRPSTP